METSKGALVVQLYVLLMGVNDIIGQSRTQQCFGKYFTESLCARETVLEVRGADFGVSICSANPSACCPQVDDDCKIDVEKSNANYYREILTKCNGRGACANLQASWVQANEECGQPNTDYVLIYYNCVTKRASTPSKSSTTSTTPIPKITTDSDDSSNDTLIVDVTTVDPGDQERHTGVFNPLGIVIGLIAAALMVSVPILVGQILLMRKDKDNSEHVETARGPDLNNDAYEYDDDDESYDSWDEDWDDDWENYPTEEVPQGVGGGKPRNQSKRRSRKSSKKSTTVEIAVVDPYVHSDSIYDVIDPRAMTKTKTDDVVLRVPKPAKSSIRDRNRTTPTQLMVNNSMYNGGYSKKMAAPPPPPLPQMDSTPVYPNSDEVYLEPSTVSTYDMAEGEYYTELETVQRHMERKITVDDKHPNVLRQDTNEGQVYWTLETTNDSTV